MMLYDKIQRRFGEDSLKAAKAFFTAAGLPEPGQDEHFAGYDSGEILFLSDEGCTLRFTAASSTIPAHPGVLQALGSRMLGNMRMDVLPGGICMPDEDLCEDLADELERDGYHFAPNDREQRNFITLPDGMVVLVDPGAVGKLSRATSTVGEALYARQRMFQSLRETFERCWPEGTAPDPEKLQEFLKACRGARDKGVLTAGWTALTGRDFGASRKIKDAAASYQRHRRHYERFGPELS